jgi:uncharacterized protein (TIGR00369 family)
MPIPESFRPLTLTASAYLASNGPFYGRWDGERFFLGLSVETKHCNAAGMCHGGMIASLCDVLLTVGGNIQSGLSRFLPTITMTCDFLAPAPAGTWIEGSLEVLRKTGSLVFVAGLLDAPPNGLIARTSGVLKISGDTDSRFARERYFD